MFTYAAEKYPRGMNDRRDVGGGRVLDLAYHIVYPASAAMIVGFTLRAVPFLDFFKQGFAVDTVAHDFSSISAPQFGQYVSPGYGIWYPHREHSAILFG